jgi:hypothetical protein
MTVRAIHLAPPPDLARALERFEEQFTYPLGAGRSFRISHGADYPRFFRSIGEGTCFVDEDAGAVRGVVGVALRELLTPNGERCEAVYVGDLKIDPAARDGRTLLRLARAVERWIAGRTRAAFSIVMDGTRAMPTDYTGRMGIPPFEELGKTMILRVPTAGQQATAAHGWRTSADRVEVAHRRLSAGRYASAGGNPRERSGMEPVWLLAPDGGACGCLEDTSRAKRLMADDGAELIGAHLSSFAYADAASGVELLRNALANATRRGFPALFVAVDAVDADEFCRLLREHDLVRAPATIYGTCLETGLAWNVNTAEI